MGSADQTRCGHSARPPASVAGFRSVSDAEEDASEEGIAGGGQATDANLGRDKDGNGVNAQGTAGGCGSSSLWMRSLLADRRILDEESASRTPGSARLIYAAQHFAHISRQVFSANFRLRSNLLMKMIISEVARVYCESLQTGHYVELSRSRLGFVSAIRK